MKIIRISTLVVLSVAVVTLSACGGGSKTPVASVGTPSANATGNSGNDVPTDAYQRALKFSGCMRAHGVDMPDPDPKMPAGATQAIPAGEDGDKTTKAYEACQKYAPPPPPSGPGTMSDPQVRLKFNKCLRAHGIKVSDDPREGTTIDEKDAPTFQKCEKEATGK
ncbi:hypothetical protein [Fodinicola feengrottensis]|uniref:Uncharacterized protein n=1 Tax=Fodinicola feengrottensis TaxID=435914 RepID=A0ABP4V560_9ACTN|nr:hypothetical protein [Fodinicola feengrottensis]